MAHGLSKRVPIKLREPFSPLTIKASMWRCPEQTLVAGKVRPAKGKKVAAAEFAAEQGLKGRRYVRQVRPLVNAPCLSNRSEIGSNFNPRNTQCIHVVKIIAFLELKQKLTFFKGLQGISPQAAFSIFTAHTLNSGILAMGSKAELVSALAGFSEK